MDIFLFNGNLSCFACNYWWQKHYVKKVKKIEIFSNSLSDDDASCDFSTIDVSYELFLEHATLLIFNAWFVAWWNGYIIEGVFVAFF